MRGFLSILFLGLSLLAIADGFVVFEKDGYFGVKDQSGNVTVPAVYETLGWTDGTSKVHYGVIGFQQNGLWGLITVKNKSLTGQKFYSINPIADGYFKASIKGKFSNYLFHGVLNEEGKTVISFNYFTIEQMGVNWLVSQFEGSQRRYGLISYENELLIPTSYRSIEEKNGFFIAKKRNYKIDLFSNVGEEVATGLDSLINKNGWVVSRGGYAGFFNHMGELVYDLKYKSVLSSNDIADAVEFPIWNVYKNDSLILTWQCDSLEAGKKDLFLAYLNGATHLISENRTVTKNSNIRIRQHESNQLIAQNSKTNSWSVLSEDGKVIINNYDSIFATEENFIVEKSKAYHILNKKGELLNRKSYQLIRKGLASQFIVSRNNFWGIVDSNHQKIASVKYDSIKLGKDNYYVSYLNRWGVMSHKGEWVVRPEFAEVFSFNGLIIGRRGRGYTIYYDGQLVRRTIDRPVCELGSLLLVRGETNKYGLYSEFGESVTFPIYDKIFLLGVNFVLEKDGIVQVVNEKGYPILPFSEEYEKAAGHSEGLFLVKKERRWGFVDNMGRLRISNRYDSAKVFSENRSAVLLKSKWGFIDKEENLKIQPYYDEVSRFNGGFAIVKRDSGYGLIDIDGKEVLELIWKSINRLQTGNYLVRDSNNKVGLVDEKGVIILRPAYDELEDIGGHVLASKNNKWGMLEYSGRPIFKINQEEIKADGDLIFIKN